MSSRTTTRRRTKYALMTGALLATITGVSGLSVALGDAFGARIDATATRDHSLEERTQRLLDALNDEHELIISASAEGLPRAGQAALGDLLDALERDDMLRVTVVDSRETLADLINRLAERDAEDMSAHAEAIATARNALAGSRDELGALLLALREFPDAHQNESALARSVEQLAGLDEQLGSFAETPYPGRTLPEADRALDALADPANTLINTLDALDRDASQIRQQGVSAGDDERTAWARRLLTGTERARDGALRAVDALRRLDPLEALRIARVIEAQEVVLLVGPERAVAIDASSVVPTDALSGADAVRSVREGERVIANALASASIQHPPIVVLVHAEQQALLDERGRPVPSAQATLGELADRLSRARVDLREWITTANTPMPDRATLDPTGQRPVVWLCPGPPSLGSRERFQRLLELGIALRRLEQRGESLLLTLTPSDADAMGETDPIADIARSFGLEIATGTPLVTVNDAGVDLWQVVRDTAEEGPLASALEGQPFAVQLPSPIAVVDPLPAGVSAHPLLSVPGSDTVWGEARWFGVATGRNPAIPTRDADRDALAGPYTVVATASRTRTGAEASPTIEGAQRLVVVAGASWFATELITAQDVVDGRTIQRFPGNGALLDASVAWLAGQDELLAQEAVIADVARVQQIPEGQLLALRLALIGGLPLGILTLGGVLRLVRG